MLSQDEWVSVLKLATKWNMLEFRRTAIENLSSSLSPLERVLLGREQMVPDWLRSGYVDLARREAALSVEEFKSLGLQTALVLSQKMRTRHSFPGGQPLFRPASEDLLFTRTMNDIFKTELHEEAASLPVIDRILLARSYGVSEWLYAGLVDLGKRQGDITLEEAKKLGLETTARLCQVREKLRTGQSASGPVRSEKMGRSFRDFGQPTLDPPIPGWGTFSGFGQPAPDPVGSERGESSRGFGQPASDPSIPVAREIDTLFAKELRGVRAAAIPYGHHDPPQTAELRDIHDGRDETAKCYDNENSSSTSRKPLKGKKRGR